MSDLSFNSDLLNHRIDVSEDFQALENIFFNADKVRRFDSASATGTLLWVRRQRKPRMAFNQHVVPYEAAKAWEFPPEYTENVETPFSLEFVSPRTVRLRVGTRPFPLRQEPSLMLVKSPPYGAPWAATPIEGGVSYRSSAGSLVIHFNPWNVVA